MAVSSTLFMLAFVQTSLALECAGRQCEMSLLQTGWIGPDVEATPLEEPASLELTTPSTLQGAGANRSGNSLLVADAVAGEVEDNTPLPMNSAGANRSGNSMLVADAVAGEVEEAVNASIKSNNTLLVIGAVARDDDGAKNNATNSILAVSLVILLLAFVTGQLLQNSQIFMCAFWAIGIIDALLIYGVQQERIMTQPYGDDMFTASVFLVFCNRLCAVFFGLGMVIAKKEQLTIQAPFWCYLIISISNVMATTCQYEALKYISFPVQMLGKSFKMMPVMLWGIGISGKQYGFKDWMVALFVTGGITLFLLTGPIDSPAGPNTSAKGLLLLLCFLVLDGITSPMQEKLFKEYATSKYNMILYVNMISACVSFFTIATSGELSSAIAFCSKHSELVTDATTLSASQVSSQFFIYSQVAEFGALVFAATMNVRQAVSIVNSYLQFGHTITMMQCLSLAMVFSALFYKSIDGLSSQPSDKARSEPLA